MMRGYVLTVRGVFREDTILRRSGNADPKGHRSVSETADPGLFPSLSGRLSPGLNTASGTNSLMLRTFANAAKTGIFRVSRLAGRVAKSHMTA